MPEQIQTPDPNPEALVFSDESNMGDLYIPSYDELHDIGDLEFSDGTGDIGDLDLSDGAGDIGEFIFDPDDVLQVGSVAMTGFGVEREYDADRYPRDIYGDQEGRGFVG